eukprot:jgi/Mesen1/7120/ME000369S06439
MEGKKSPSRKVATMLINSPKWSSFGRRWKLCLCFGLALFILCCVCDTWTIMLRGYTMARTLQAESVAICLVGGARAFDLTGLSIKEHLLAAYPNSDVFLHVPADENTHKLTALLGTRRIARLEVVAQRPMKEDATTAQVLKAKGSPNGVQVRARLAARTPGLLQYFDLVEGCTRLITEHERQHNMEYRWILRTRVDGFWNGAPPLLSSLDPSVYTLPNGTDAGGFNDRLGVGVRQLSIKALRRLSVLPTLGDRNYVYLNSEASFEAHLGAWNVSVGRADFPFCVLSHRQYSWPDGPANVISIASGGSFNGAKCRPCHAAAVGAEARRMMLRLAHYHGMIGDGTGVQICNAQGPWEVDWDALFDATAGPRAASARKSIVSRSFKDCVAENRALLKSALLYRGPPPSLLCLVGRWGELHTTGPSADPWPLYHQGLDNHSVIYSVCTACSLEWETRVALERGFQQIHAFDSAPEGPLQVVGEVEGKVPGRIFLHGWSIGPTGGGPAGGESGGEEALLGIAAELAKHHSKGQEALRPRKSLSSTMEELGHLRVDVLKMDMTSSAYELLSEWDAAQVHLPVCQLLLSYGKPWAGQGGYGPKDKTFESLVRLGFHRIKCVGTYFDERCIFLSSKNCVNL